jgi:hypothetical protein
MEQRIKRLADSALNLKCQSCGKLLLKADPDRLERHKCYRIQAGPADLRDPLPESMPGAATIGAPMCEKCKESIAATPDLAWDRFPPEMMLKFASLLRKLLGVGDDVQLSELLEILVMWYRGVVKSGRVRGA